MDSVLSDVEVRVLGCLMEKEKATPEYYPLSLNALINACNQKSNRLPVVCYDEETVVTALESLVRQKLVRQSNVGRVAKYEQIFSQKLNLVGREEAILCILLLRGPQTPGEMRGRTERLYAFADLEEVQLTIVSLEDLMLVKKLPLQSGRKESRYVQLLGKQAEPSAAEFDFKAETTVVMNEGRDRIEELEEQITLLRQELHELRKEFDTFRAQFD